MEEIRRLEHNGDGEEDEEAVWTYSFDISCSSPLLSLYIVIIPWLAGSCLLPLWILEC
jgi:hypothetical protein